MPAAGLSSAIALLGLILAATPDEDRRRVSEALACVPKKPGMRCATLVDDLGAVETYYPTVWVLSTAPHPKTKGWYSAQVLRANRDREQRVLFEYELDSDFVVRSRACRASPPPGNVPLATLTHAPDFVTPGGAKYVDPCSRKACDMRSTEWIVPIRDGHLGRPVEHEQWTSDDGACPPLAGQTLPLPHAPVVIEEVRGWVGTFDMEALRERLGPGALELPRDLYLAPWASIRLRVSGVLIEVRNDKEEAVLKLVADPRMNAAFSKLGKSPEAKEHRFQWSPPFLLQHGQLSVYELSDTRFVSACHKLEAYGGEIPRIIDEESLRSGPLFLLASLGRARAYTCPESPATRQVKDPPPGPPRP